MQSRTRLNGFTVLELLVVIAMIVIVAALLLPTLARSKAMGSSVVCLNNLKQWGLATHLYAGDNDDLLPPEGFANPTATHTNTGWYIQLPETIQLERYHAMEWRTNAAAPLSMNIWICPNNPRRSNGKNLFHYALNSYLDGSGTSDSPTMIASVAQPHAAVWLFDSKNLPAIGGWSFVHTNLHSVGAQFLFVDGHVARFRNFEYWDMEKDKGRTNNPSLIWRP